MMGGPKTAEILLETPEVVEEAGDDGESHVRLSGTMFTNGLNANYWGLTEEGAKSIATSLEGSDLTAGHPPVVGYGFTRSIHDGPGKPIGDVLNTGVKTVGGAKMAEFGGGYTAEYKAQVSSERYSDDFKSGLMIGGDYGVSIGITAEDEDAVCSVCDAVFAECKHRRGEEVNGNVAGPLYRGGEADHLAVVYVPAWEEADAEVTASAEDQAMMASNATEFFGQPFNQAEQHQSSSEEEAIQTREWSDGDLVQWQAVPELFGMIEHVDDERMVVMVGIHNVMDGELMPTGFTITAGYGDVTPLEEDDIEMLEDMSSYSPEPSSDEARNDTVAVAVEKEPEFRLNHE